MNPDHKSRRLDGRGSFAKSAALWGRKTKKRGEARVADINESVEVRVLTFGLGHRRRKAPTRCDLRPKVQRHHGLLRLRGLTIHLDYRQIHPRALTYCDLRLPRNYPRARCALFHPTMDLTNRGSFRRKGTLKAQLSPGCCFRRKSYVVRRKARSVRRCFDSRRSLHRAQSSAEQRGWYPHSCVELRTAQHSGCPMSLVRRVRNSEAPPGRSLQRSSARGKWMNPGWPVPYCRTGFARSCAEPPAPW